MTWMFGMSPDGMTWMFGVSLDNMTWMFGMPLDNMTWMFGMSLDSMTWMFGDLLRKYDMDVRYHALIVWCLVCCLLPVKLRAWRELSLCYIDNMTCSQVCWNWQYDVHQCLAYHLDSNTWMFDMLYWQYYMNIRYITSAVWHECLECYIGSMKWMFSMLLWQCDVDVWLVGGMT